MQYILIENKKNPCCYFMCDELVLIGNAPDNAEFRSSNSEKFSNAFIEYVDGKVFIKSNPSGKELLINSKGEKQKFLENEDIIEVEGAFSFIFFFGQDDYINYLEKKLGEEYDRTSFSSKSKQVKFLQIKLGIRFFDTSNIELTDKCNSSCR